MILYLATILLAPVTKKNHQRVVLNRKTGAHFIKQSAAYETYERDACRLLAKPPHPISKPVNVKCLFFMPTRRRVDLVNLLEAADDILVRREVLQDDDSKIIVSHDGSRVLYDKEHPRTEVYITEVTENA